MISTTTLVVATCALAVGTYAARFAGPVLRARIQLSPQFEMILATAAVVMLLSLAVTSALFEGHDLAGVARPVGVAVGGVLAWRKAPFALVVIAAAATAAGLRYLGVA
ncbi:AzlD domain-containing protein [Antrihabitans sp. YC2-6]|uniref:AzlD domain-containing protein n=1 Tax=Antrihabitans sp. YC2-6 TaxID=2799498 RepID=UPI0018F554B4|nr:AzlD domain-containing protein [Antrihabitans sp. YC2-6]MBJ8348450.1 AzlD domain-containing protein [Antrihabitans sp. YC2-6]